MCAYAGKVDCGAGDGDVDVDLSLVVVGQERQGARVVVTLPLLTVLTQTTKQSHTKITITPFYIHKKACAHEKFIND